MVLINPDEFHNDPNNAEKSARLKLKTPKRVLHFSDGILEEYSDDDFDDEGVEAKKENTIVDPSIMTWGPWLWYKMLLAGSSTLSVIDSLGESLAAFFGITTPRYYFELEEYKRNQERLSEQRDEERGWSQTSDLGAIPLKDLSITQSQPMPV